MTGECRPGPDVIRGSACCTYTLGEAEIPSPLSPAPSTALRDVVRVGGRMRMLDRAGRRSMPYIYTGVAGTVIRALDERIVEDSQQFKPRRVVSRNALMTRILGERVTPTWVGSLSTARSGSVACPSSRPDSARLRPMGFSHVARVHKAWLESAFSSSRPCAARNPGFCDSVAYPIRVLIRWKINLHSTCHFRIMCSWFVQTSYAWETTTFAAF